MPAPYKCYFGGHDVFREDYKTVVVPHIKQVCESLNIIPLLPGESHLVSYVDIFAENIRMLDQADVMIANFDPFRGGDADSGTSWEAGYARGRGIPCFAYMKDPDETLRQKVVAAGLASPGDIRDCHGQLIEDFNLPCNLMLALGARSIEPSVEAAATAAVNYLRRSQMRMRG